MSPSPSEAGGSGVSIIAEQAGPPAAPASSDAGTSSAPVTEPPVTEPPVTEPPSAEPPPMGAAGSTSREPPAPPEPSPCAAGQSLGPNGRCFAVLDTALPWADARESCQALGQGWDLAVPRSAELNAFLATLLPDEAWIGGTDQVTEELWRWVDDGSVFWQGDEAGAAPAGAFANWNPTEPNGGGNSDCLRLVPRIDFRWADLECAMARIALCEGPLAAEPL